MNMCQLINFLFLFFSMPTISLGMQEPMVIENPMTVEQPTIKIQFKDEEVDYPVAEYAKVIRRSPTLQFSLYPYETINFVSDFDLAQKILQQPVHGIPNITYETFQAIQNIITQSIVTPKEITETDTKKLCDLVNATHFLDIEYIRNKALKKLAIKAFGDDLKGILNAEFFKTYCTYSLPADLQKKAIKNQWKVPPLIKNFNFNGEITDIALSPDHSYFVVHFRGIEDTIIYHIMTGQRFYLKNDGAGAHLAISPDNLTIATSSYDDKTFSGSIKLWDVKTQKIIAEKRFENQMPGIIKFTSDGKQIAMKLALSNIIEFYKTSDFPNEISFRRQFRFAPRILSNFALAQDPHNPNNYYLLISVGKEVYLYSTQSEDPLFTYEHIDKIITDIAISLDGNIVVTGASGGLLIIRVIESNQSKWLRMKPIINSVALGSNNDYLVVGAEKAAYFTLLKKKIEIGKPIYFNDNSPIQFFEYDSPIQKIDISLDNQYLLIATQKQIQIRHLFHPNFINNLTLAEAQVLKLITEHNLTEQQIPDHLKPVYQSLQEKIKKFQAESLGQQ